MPQELPEANGGEVASPRQVLVLNTTYEPINVCSAKRALILLLKGKAEMLEAGPQWFHSEHVQLVLPLVIKLRLYVKIPRGDARRLSRRAVLARDSYRCQYCGSTRHLTLDHVIPKSRGGPHTWDNVVTSCAVCNTHKGSRLPHEAGFHLHAKPRPPSLVDFLVSSPHGVPKSWAPYLLDEAVA
jgi:5-methylcytosine-specific restriction endonuclease McrA